MKKILIILNILSLFILASCDDDSNTTTGELPVTIDYNQVVGAGANDKYISYKQDGLTVEIVDFGDIPAKSHYKVEQEGEIWLYPARLKISNINTLKGLNKISFSWSANNTISMAMLYDVNGKLIGSKTNYNVDNNNYVYEGEFVFKTNLKEASYLIIEGYENKYSSIVFE